MTTAGYDGSIKIDSRIEEKNFNRGISNMSKSIAKLKTAISFAFAGSADVIYKSLYAGKAAIQRFGSFAAGILKNALLGGLLFFALSAASVLRSVRESMGELITIRGGSLAKDIESIKGQFTELRAAVANAFLPLLEFAIPYIKMALSWLIQLFNRVAMITAAFLGQKEVLQIVEGSAVKLAKNIEKVKKAAQGALAAFDQINVLRLPEATLDTPSGVEPATVAAELVPITDDILKKVAEIKNEIAEWFADPMGKLQELWGKFKDWFKEHIINPIVEWWETSWLNTHVVEPIKTWFKETWENIKTWAFEAWENIKEFSKNAWLGTIAIWGIAWSWFVNHVFAPLVKLFGSIWSVIQDDSLTAREKILKIWEIIVEWFKLHILEPLRQRFSEAWEKIKMIWSNAGAWISTHVSEPIRNAFGSALDSIKSKWETTFLGIKNFVSGIINDILNNVINTINQMIEAMNSFSGLFGFGTMPIIPALPGPSGSTGGRIPRLATGAVIPANSQFLAVLGDQRGHRNLEAPEPLIRQIIREEIGKIDASVSVSFEGSWAQFIREMKPHFDKETVRIGGTLLRGGKS